MGGVFYVWLIPLLAVIALSLGILYLSIRRTWPAEDDRKSPLEKALEQERAEAQADQLRQAESPGNNIPT